MGVNVSEKCYVTLEWPLNAVVQELDITERLLTCRHGVYSVENVLEILLTLFFILVEVCPCRDHALTPVTKLTVTPVPRVSTHCQIVTCNIKYMSSPRPRSRDGHQTHGDTGTACQPPLSNSHM